MGNQASLPTRIAARAREDAAGKWRDHRKSCPVCDKATRERRPRGLCGRGRALNLDYAQATADYQENRRADAAPDPNQGELWA
jgi:hypothetical protein